MKILKKGLALSLAAILSCTMMAGCGGNESVEPTQTNKNGDKPYEGVTLHYAVSESATQGGETVELVNLVKEKTGINTMTAEDPMTAVAIGTGKYVEFLGGYRE